MAATGVGPFWDMVEGKKPAPPAAQLLGWKLLEIDPEAGTIRVEFDGKASFLNPAGTIQGGLLGAMLDDTMGPAAMAYLGGRQMAQTLELKTSFLRPGKVGPIVGEGRVVHRGRDVLFLEGTLKDGEGNTIATATATARIVSIAQAPG